MLRVLRKYNRTLLAVFGSGIMIVFLLGNADVVGFFSNLGGESTWVAKFADGREISRDDMALVQQELQVIDKLKLPPFNLPNLPIVGDITRNADLFIQLAHEARAAGMIGGPGSLRMSPDEVLTLSINLGSNPVAVRYALADYEGIARYLQRVIRAGMLSTNRLVREGRRQMETTDALLAVIPAEADPDADAPDDASMQAQFEAWKDVDPGEGDHGFGYRLPDRVTAQWLSIPRSAVEAGVRRGVESDDTTLRMFWRRNEGRFPTIGDSTDIPILVTDAFVREETDRRLRDLDRTASDLFRNPRRGFESIDGVISLPEDWSDRQLSMDDLRTALIEDFDLEDAAVGAVADSGEALVSVEVLSRDDAFRFAGTDRFGPTPGPVVRSRWLLADLLASLHEFGGGAVPLQAGVGLPVLASSNGDRIFVRVNSAEANRAPHNLDEVREAVDTDLRRLARYNELLGQSGAIEALARSGGLDAVADMWNVELVGPTSMQRNFTPGLPRPPIVPGLGRDQSVVDALVDASVRLGARPLSELPEADRIVLIPSDKYMAIVVGRLDRRVPVSDAVWASLLNSGQIVAMSAMNDFGGPDMPVLVEAFSSDALAARHGYERSGGDSEDDLDDFESTDDDAAAADAS
jgi:hypothetical protein